MLQGPEDQGPVLFPGRGSGGRAIGPSLRLAWSEDKVWLWGRVARLLWMPRGGAEMPAKLSSSAPGPRQALARTVEEGRRWGCPCRRWGVGAPLGGAVGSTVAGAQGGRALGGAVARPLAGDPVSQRSTTHPSFITHSFIHLTGLLSVLCVGRRAGGRDILVPWDRHGHCPGADLLRPR